MLEDCINKFFREKENLGFKSKISKIRRISGSSGHAFLHDLSLVLFSHVIFPAAGTS
jgi:hypothetical protein